MGEGGRVFIIRRKEGRGIDEGLFFYGIMRVLRVMVEDGV